MSGRLAGKVALITGAARGQGLATAKKFAAEGARVFATDVLDDLGDEATAGIEDMSYMRLDVTDENEWAVTVDTVLEHVGRLDVLVNNAGIVALTPIESATQEDWDRIIAVNQTGVFLGMRAVASTMTAAGGGAIINISSIDGMVGMPYMIAYVASKFAVRGMTKTAAAELGGRGIRVNSIHPGGVATPMLDGIGLPADQLFGSAPLGRIAQPDEVAELSLFLASEESSYCTGSEFVIDGGLTASISIPPEVLGGA